MKVVVVGATGMVGRVMLRVLEEQNIIRDELLVVASNQSIGKKIEFAGQKLIVQSLQSALDQRPDIALFSAGGNVSKEWAPKFAKKGCFVIDNSSAWRMDENTPLVVPEINADQITADTKIIANPNCSTIQMVLALRPLQHIYGIKRLVVSTYQSVTGSGVKGLNQLMAEREGKEAVEKAYPHAIDLNVIPHGGDFLENDYTTEEMKLVHETRKILACPNMPITATVVRVPVTGGHSEALNIELNRPYEMDEAKKLIGMMPGVVMVDFPAGNIYPTPLLAEKKDQVFVGRIRRDESVESGINMWVVADNLRKGAATNAVQIAKVIMMKGLV
ncbi:MAG: aspartate-semialdehyde dehydrogenase [Bacteroidetes bacterium]|nr:MAG: aspartate-semialdehyde dehydrogenase [Bacteroidota bacterium]